ncbi:MAG TPA: flagellar biosynthetic protein FliR [Anaerolineaceae bacterium]|nr:flagellar biosynthetic protein FliR [Anaerolineaceae bacterium]
MSVSIAQAQVFFLVLTRVMALIIHVPVLGGQSIPNQVRIGLGLVLSAIMIPWQILPPEAPAIDWMPFTVAIGREILIGTLAGFAAILTFSALQIAGEMMSTASGFSASRVLNPAMGESGSAFDQLFIMTAMLLFLVLNGHHIFLSALQQTFVVAPVNTPFPTLDAEYLARLTAQLIVSGIQLSLPVVGALLLTDITLALLARVAPQVQVFFLGLPLKVGVGVIALGLTFSLTFPMVGDLFRGIGPKMLQLIGR